MRPQKLNEPSVLVVWGSRELTLAEKVIWYRDWSLDAKGPDACYAGPAGISAGLGGSLTPGTVATLRQRLKRLGLHHVIDRGPGANAGWVATLPPGCKSATSREAAARSLDLDAHIRAHDRGLAAVPDGRIDVPAPPEQRFMGGRNTDSGVSAAAFGGVGGVSSRSSMRETQLSSAVSSLPEKGVGALAPKEKRGEAEVREEWVALEKLKKGQPLTDRERQLVRAWTERKDAEAAERRRAAAS